MLKRTPALLIFILVIFSCDKVQEHKSTTDSVRTAPATDTSARTSSTHKIAPPFQDIDIAFEQFTIDAKNGGTVISAKGSKIIVPADAFTNMQGKPVTEQVALQYREYRDIDELIVSGIPMTYQHGAGREHFITAGMFELQGRTVSGETVQIAKDKEVQVDMASTVSASTSGVDFYYLDQSAAEWQMLGASARRHSSTSQASEEQQQDKEVKTNTIPVSKADKDAYKFELDLDYSKMSELKDYKDIIWQYVPTEGYDNPQTFEGFAKERWTGAKITDLDKSKKLYIVELSSKTKVFKSVVTPVVGEKTYQKALKKAKSDSKIYKKRVEEVEAYNAQKAMVSMQLASVSQFGIYNHDIFYKPEDKYVTNLKLKLPQGQKMEFTRVFLIMKKAKGMIEYAQHGYDKLSSFTFNPNEYNGLLVVYPHNKISVVSAKDFKKLKFSNITELDLSSETQVNSYKNFKNIIENI